MHSRRGITCPGRRELAIIIGHLACDPNYTTYDVSTQRTCARRRELVIKGSIIGSARGGPAAVASVARGSLRRRRPPPHQRLLIPFAPALAVAGLVAVARVIRSRITCHTHAFRFRLHQGLVFASDCTRA